MKKIFVVFGALVIFLFIAFSAYAVENNTWGEDQSEFWESRVCG